MARTQIIEPTKRLLKTEDDQPHNICAYCRVSTDELDQKNSLVAQKQFFQRYFHTHPNWNNVGIFADEGLSGTSLEKREQFNRMLDLARRGGVDTILTKEVSRFSRNVQDLLNIVEELRKKEVYIWFLSDDINTERNDYREKLTQIATNAEQESLRTSRRVKWGHQQQMQLGVVFGRKEMYGYNIVKDENGIQHFQIIEEEAEVVRNIFKWYAAGDGTHTIGRRLEQMGIKTKRFKYGWTNIVILRLLRNEKYVGDLAQGKTYTPDPLTHKKKYNRGQSHMFFIENHHPESAIVDRDLWNKVQQILKEKEPSAEIKAKHSNRYWISGKVFCGICGGRYVSYHKKQKNAVYKAWVCFENHQRGTEKQITLDTGEVVKVGCNALRVNDKVLKTAVGDIITQIIKPRKEELIAQMKSEIEKLNRPKDNTKQIDSIEKRIQTINEEMTELALQLARKVLTEEIYTRASNKQQAELSELRETLDQLKDGDKSAETASRYLTECIKQMETIIDLADEELNEGLFERITKRIVVYPDNLLEIHLSFMPRAVYLRYEATGKSDAYKVQFTILSEKDFTEAVKSG